MLWHVSTVCVYRYTNPVDTCTGRIQIIIGNYVIAYNLETYNMKTSNSGSGSGNNQVIIKKLII